MPFLSSPSRRMGRKKRLYRGQMYWCKYYSIGVFIVEVVVLKLEVEVTTSRI